MKGPVPPRIHVLLSRRGTTAVVIRRGPSKVVATFLWDRETDEIRVGQWLRGRIYERRADLSVDGRYLIYFAMNGHWTSQSKGAWTAISRAPYLKAIVLLPKGDCWNGGGLFLDDRRYWLNGAACHERLRDSTEVTRDPTYAPPHIGNNECLGVYYPRLVRDGWTLVRDETNGMARLTTFEKPLHHGWTLRKLAHATIDQPVGKSVYYDEHQLENAKTGQLLSLPDWEWADLDQKRLAWVAGGKLYAGRIGREGPYDVRELRDFSSDEFERLTAPY